MSRLRGFQQEVQDKSFAAWNSGSRVVMPVIPTGGGKTVLMGDTAKKFGGYGAAIAHRKELVSQISISLAKEEVRHDIVAPAAIVRSIVNSHIRECGRSYYDARGAWKVASVDTLLRREMDESWMRKVGMVFQDEGHHVLRDNKWGRAFQMFPSNPYGFFPTATPRRADNKGLGSHSHGLVDVMVEGPDMRWMIDNGYLTPYEVHGVDPPKDMALTEADISPETGDYKLDRMRKVVKQSTQRVGDVVKTYLKWAPGKLGITFAVDVEDAQTLAAEYNRCGVPAVVVTSETLGTERDKIMERFVKREILQLVNVDLFGEGVDVPELEVVSMARPTASYALYVQQFGRVLRLKISSFHAQQWDTYDVETRRHIIATSGKARGIVLDHVGNVIKHGGPPDYRIEPWSLDARTKRTAPTDTIAMRLCLNENCQQPYERFHIACPYCGTEPPAPAERVTTPAQVDGDIILYSPELLQELFGKVKHLDGPPVIPLGKGPIVARAVANQHAARQEAQRQLREAIQLVLPPGLDPRVAQKRFYLWFGVDVLTAHTLGSAEAEKLKTLIIEKVERK